MADNNTLINAELNDDDLLDITGGYSKTSGGEVTTVKCKCGTSFEISVTATRYKCPSCKAYYSRGTKSTSTSGTRG